MTDNLKKFLEAASQDKAFIEKLTKAETPETVIDLAAEKGFTLTKEDLKPSPASGEMFDAELDAVAGGKACACVLGGGGEASGNDDLCWCVFQGDGSSADRRDEYDYRCYCVAAGGGTSKNP